MTRRLVAHFLDTATCPRGAERLAVLNARERDVLTLIARGLSNTRSRPDCMCPKAP